MNVQLQSTIARVAELTDADRRRMLALMDRFYDNVSPAMFAADLAEKQWVIQVLHPETGELCGFSTQMLIDLQLGPRAVQALFSGDTIVDERYWGEQALLRAAGKLARSLIESSPDVRRYWFLLSQGYKTYRFLPVFFREFHPCYDRPTPADVQEVLDALAHAKYPQRYDAAAGVIRASHDQYHLRAGVAEVTPERQRDPHVQFFLERNPGHARGDELCCLAALDLANFTPAASRFLS